MTASALKRPVNVLMVEDNESDAFQVRSALENSNQDEFSIVHAQSLEEAIPFQASNTFDVVLLDLSLPGISELDALKNIRHAAPHLPVVILSGHDDEALALSAVQLGAQDYMVKERFSGSQLRRGLRYAVERKNFEEKLSTLANYDALTGLANRSLFTSRLEMALARGRRSGKEVVVFFLDLDRFKQVNDTLGHEAGDTLLKEAAHRLKQCLREYDTIARFGGDEFAVLLEDSGQPRDCAIIAQKMIDVLAAPFTTISGDATLGLSIGIAHGSPASTAEELLRHADAAMYRAKSVPQSDYRFYTGHLQQRANEHMRLEKELEKALESEDELRIYYQPKMNAVTGYLSGAEALIRWNHPEHGLLAPVEFLPLIQGTSLEHRVDRWVVEAVCRDQQAWNASGVRPIRVSLHLAKSQWENPQLPELFPAIFKKYQTDTRSLAIEVEETALIRKSSNRYDLISQVRDLGIEIHLDNFGADLASMKLVTSCPLDAIKLDRRLINTVDYKPEQALLTRTLIELAHHAGMKTIAEGVELAEQRRMLVSMGCDEIQGMLTSPPMPAHRFLRWIHGYQPIAA